MIENAILLSRNLGADGVREREREGGWGVEKERVREREK